MKCEAETGAYWEMALEPEVGDVGLQVWNVCGVPVRAERKSCCFPTMTPSVPASVAESRVPLQPREHRGLLAWTLHTHTYTNQAAYRIRAVTDWTCQSRALPKGALDPTMLEAEA